MTLQALRHRIGNDVVPDACCAPGSQQHSDGNGTVEQFEALAEQVSGQDLDGFFEAWLRSGTRPARTAANGLG